MLTEATTAHLRRRNCLWDRLFSKVLGGIYRARNFIERSNFDNVGILILSCIRIGKFSHLVTVVCKPRGFV